MKSPGTAAYIDATNLDKAMRFRLGWKLSYLRFRTYLRDKFSVEQAIMFTGYLSYNKSLYKKLNDTNYDLCFREVTYSNGLPKANCDSDLIVKVLEDVFLNSVRSVVLVTSDGDYMPLINLLNRIGVKGSIISPNPPDSCAKSLKKSGWPIIYINGLRGTLEHK
jgi:uncharacterized LabA/DUF88 family protein